MKHLRLPLAASILLFSFSLAFAQTERSSAGEDEANKTKKAVSTEKVAKDVLPAEKKAATMKGKASTSSKLEKPSSDSDIKKTRSEVAPATKVEKTESEPGFFKRLFGKKEPK